MKAIILYATRKGSTADTARRIAGIMEKSGVQVDVANVDSVVDLSTPYDAAVLLTPIYKGVWLPEMTRFARQQSHELGDTPVWGLFPCIRVLQFNGEHYANQHYIPTKMMRRFNVQNIKFSAGRLVKSEVTHEDMVILSARYDGETLAQISGDYRDWEDLERWAGDIILAVQTMRVRS